MDTCSWEQVFGPYLAAPKVIPMELGKFIRDYFLDRATEAGGKVAWEDALFLFRNLPIAIERCRAIPDRAIVECLRGDSRLEIDDEGVRIAVKEPVLGSAQIMAVLRVIAEPAGISEITLLLNQGAKNASVERDVERALRREPRIFYLTDDNLWALQEWRGVAAEIPVATIIPCHELRKDVKPRERGRRDASRAEPGYKPQSIAEAVFFAEIKQIGPLNATEEQSLGRVMVDGLWAQRRLEDMGLPSSVDQGSESGDELWRIVERGRQARDRLVISSLPLVLKIARQYRHSGIPLLDLVQDGCCGLLAAVERWQNERGTRFRIYAAWWIWNSISRAALAQGYLFRLPAHTYQLLSQLRRAKAQLEQALGHEPSAEQIGERLDATLWDHLPTKEEDGDEGEQDELPVKRRRSGRHDIRTWISLLGALQPPLSIDKPPPAELAGQLFDPDDGDATLADLIPSSSDDVLSLETERAALRQRVQDMLLRLTPRQVRVLHLRYGLGDDEERTLQEVGDDMGVTRERIRQIERKALDVLQRPLHDFWR